jgi:hypothetical protein
MVAPIQFRQTKLLNLPENRLIKMEPTTMNFNLEFQNRDSYFKTETVISKQRQLPDLLW